MLWVLQVFSATTSSNKSMSYKKWLRGRFIWWRSKE